MDHTWAGIPEAASEVAPRLSVGGLFVEALARRDFATLACCLGTNVRLRALLPRGPFELAGRDEVAGWFRSLFGGPDSVALADVPPARPSPSCSSATSGLGADTWFARSASPPSRSTRATSFSY